MFSDNSHNPSSCYTRGITLDLSFKRSMNVRTMIDRRILRDGFHENPTMMPEGFGED